MDRLFTNGTTLRREEPSESGLKVAPERFQGGLLGANPFADKFLRLLDVLRMGEEAFGKCAHGEGHHEGTLAPKLCGEFRSALVEECAAQVACLR